MRFTTFDDLGISEQFKTNEIKNHPYHITVWRKINDCYKYLEHEANYENNARSLYCFTAFKKHDLVWALNEEEAHEQQEIYKQWCSRYVSMKDAEQNVLILKQEERAI